MRTVSLLPLLALGACATVPAAPVAQADISSRNAPVIAVDGLRFRDLNRDGRLTPYEDWRLTPQARADDLVARMTLEEKAGLMVVATVPLNAWFGEPATGYDAAGTASLLRDSHVTHFISRLSTETSALAAANNAVQEAAEGTRLGIPALMMTDPRHGYTELAGASVAGGRFSQWPNGLGIAALADPAFTQDYAALVRDDLRAAGFGMLLGPQIDLGTEPRWPRIFDTFGEDAQISADTAEAFVRGLQGGPDGIAPGGVAAVIKHFAGYSASANGFDAHNYYGRFSRLNEAEWQQHLRPFIGGLRSHPSGVMPAYTIAQELQLGGQPLEQVGAGYNRVILTDVLRGQLGFDGVILSDWAITADCNQKCRDGAPAGERPSFADISTAWGVDDLTRVQRFAKSLDAGMDQFGGVDDPSPLLEAVRSGLVSEARLDQSVRRILVQSIQLGLFESPFVDPEAAAANIGTPAEIARGIEAQAASMVLLKASTSIRWHAGAKVALFGVGEEAARAAGLVPVSNPAEADFAILRTRSPSEMLHPGWVFGAMHQEGSLAFPADHPALAFMAGLPEGLPLVAEVQLDRPAILTPFVGRAQVLLGSFGAGDAALLKVLSGQVSPRGRLPFELPSSMAAVEAQRPGTAADSANPLFPLGFRLEL